MKGRRAKRLNKKTKVNSIIRVFIILFILIMLIYLVYGLYKESKIKIVEKDELEKVIYTSNTENNLTNHNVEKNELNSEQNSTKQALIEKVPNEYLGYKVSAKLEIPKMNINSNVLEEYSKEGLEKCISKFWGPEPNEIGNYCIAGHNYARKNMFGYLGDLEIGDKIYLSDNKNGKYSYTIYEKYRVEPENTDALSQNTNKREITLITCSSYFNKRLIIKAVEDANMR